MRNAGELRALPIGLEPLVDMVAALGRLDPGEFDAGVGDRVPVDRPLVLGDVDAVDRVVGRFGIAVVEVEHRRAAAAAAGERQRQRGKPAEAGERTG